MNTRVDRIYQLLSILSSILSTGRRGCGIPTSHLRKAPSVHDYKKLYKSMIFYMFYVHITFTIIVVFLPGIFILY